MTPSRIIVAGTALSPKIICNPSPEIQSHIQRHQSVHHKILCGFARTIVLCIHRIANKKIKTKITINEPFAGCINDLRAHSRACKPKGYRWRIGQQGLPQRLSSTRHDRGQKNPQMVSYRTRAWLRKA